MQRASFQVDGIIVSGAVRHIIIPCLTKTLPFNQVSPYDFQSLLNSLPLIRV